MLGRFEVDDYMYSNTGPAGEALRIYDVELLLEGLLVKAGVLQVQIVDGASYSKPAWDGGYSSGGAEEAVIQMEVRQ